MDYQRDYWDLHDELVTFLRSHFSLVESGLQCDSHISILDGDEKVLIDTFTSMKHQIKSRKSGRHVQAVLQSLQRAYKLKIYDKPELESHEAG